MNVIVSVKSQLARLATPHVLRFLGMDIAGSFKWLGATTNWSPQARAAWRLERLNGLLDFCWKHVRFYREYWGDHGVRQRRLGAVEELAAFPVLQKELLKASPDAFVPDTLSAYPHKQDSTGGSTGQPIKYRQDLELHALRHAFLYHGWGLAGYSFGDPLAVLSGGRLLPDLKRLSRGRVRATLERTLPLMGVHMDPELARHYHRRMVAFGARFLHGYPSIISEFATCLADQGLSLTELEGVFTTAEMLLPRYRENIEARLHCRVWDSYGCNDGGILSWECSRHDGLHYNDLESIIECLDQQANGSGRLLITNLWNHSLPFVRYESGDLVTLAETQCSCGQPFPLIKSVIGRTADILRFGNGRILSGPALTLIFRDMPIDAWQVVQTGANRIEVLVKSAKHLSAESRHFIRSVLSSHAGENVEIVIQKVDSLRATAAGKWKPVWSLEEVA